MKNNLDQFKNDRTIQVMDYLITEKKVENQKDLAAKTKIQESTLSNIRNKIKKVSPRTINKICSAFPGLINPMFMLGTQPYMLMEDVIYYQLHPEEDVFSDKYVPIGQREKAKPQEANTTGVIELYSQLIKELENMRRQLSSELEAVKELREQLSQDVKHLHSTSVLLSHMSLTYPEQTYEQFRAADPDPT